MTKQLEQLLWTLNLHKWHQKILGRIETAFKNQKQVEKTRKM